jgi:hypothetical protein
MLSTADQLGLSSSSSLPVRMFSKYPYADHKFNSFNTLPTAFDAPPVFRTGAGAGDLSIQQAQLEFLDQHRQFQQQQQQQQQLSPEQRLNLLIQQQQRQLALLQQQAQGQGQRLSSQPASHFLNNMLPSQLPSPCPTQSFHLPPNIPPSSSKEQSQHQLLMDYFQNSHQMSSRLSMPLLQQQFKQPSPSPPLQQNQSFVLDLKAKMADISKPSIAPNTSTTSSVAKAQLEEHNKFKSLQPHQFQPPNYFNGSSLMNQRILNHQLLLLRTPQNLEEDLPLESPALTTKTL